VRSPPLAASVRQRALLAKNPAHPTSILPVARSRRVGVATLKKEGRSRDEIVAARPTAAFDAKWGNFVVDPGYFTRLVYEGV
jgi:hypothetical protein